MYEELRKRFTNEQLFISLIKNDKNLNFIES